MSRCVNLSAVRSACILLGSLCLVVSTSSLTAMAQDSFIPSWMRWGGGKSAETTPSDPFLRRGTTTNASSAPAYRTAANTQPGTGSPSGSLVAPRYSAQPQPSLTQPPRAVASPAYPQTNAATSTGKIPPTPAPVTSINQYRSQTGVPQYPSTGQRAVVGTISDAQVQYPTTSANSGIQSYPEIQTPKKFDSNYPTTQPQASTPQSRFNTGSSVYGRSGPATGNSVQTAPTGSRYAQPYQNQYNPPVKYPSTTAASKPVENRYPQYQAKTPQRTASRPTNTYPQRPVQPTAASKEGELFEPAKIVALVAGEPILAGDILGPINQMMQEKIAELPPEQRALITKEEIAKQKKLALKQMLPGAIESKMVFLDFMRSIPDEHREELQGRLDSQYEELQLEEDLKNAKVNSPAELDLKLRSLGSSLEKKKRTFIEQMVAHQQLRQNVNTDEEVTHQQMLDYYRENAKQYSKPTRVKWEQIMVKFANFPNRAEAEHAMVDMGNQVLRGAPFEAVAKRQSQGLRAARGGKYDWTTQGGLKNETVDKMIFTLPVGKMSQIITSDEGFHIVRVTEREDASMEPFTEAQVGIKKKIKDQRAKNQMREYLDQLRLKTEVWTIFDEPESNNQSTQTARSQTPPSRTNPNSPSRF